MILLAKTKLIESSNPADHSNHDSVTTPISIKFTSDTSAQLQAALSKFKATFNIEFLENTNEFFETDNDFPKNSSNTIHMNSHIVSSENTGSEYTFKVLIETPLDQGFNTIDYIHGKSNENLEYIQNFTSSKVQVILETPTPTPTSATDINTNGMPVNHKQPYIYIQGNSKEIASNALIFVCDLLDSVQDEFLLHKSGHSRDHRIENKGDLSPPNFFKSDIRSHESHNSNQQYLNNDSISNKLQTPAANNAKKPAYVSNDPLSMLLSSSKPQSTESKKVHERSHLEYESDSDHETYHKASANRQDGGRNADSESGTKPFWMV
ncbi:hypothetical protein AYI68_g2444 [Smittium mucronatum]|uniref:Uncharacterized protein n=1 Tax=Smittium mucronatum TaxID=133383 RepID=A0A1R0H2M9_9FUNG|nr:hypothetical protein AYI68_g2444 [Smittium mucronatum]